MAGKSDTNAKSVLEKIRAAEYSDSVSAEMLQAVYALEHDKQFEDRRGSVEAALRNLITEAIQEPS